MRYINTIILIAVLVVVLGCASFENTYMGTAEFKTMEECRIAYRLSNISDKKLFQCVVDRLPETLW